MTEIQKELDVSVGAISAITKEECRKKEYYVYIHELAKKFRSKNLAISDVISGVRLYNKIKKVGLTCSFFENFLESTNTESYRLNKDHSEFLEDIKRILHFEESCGVKIWKIPVYMNDAIKHRNKVRRENKELIEENKRLYSQHKLEKSEIEEYLKERPLFLEYKRNKDRYPKYPEWVTTPEVFEEASTKIGTKIEPKIFYNKLRRVYLFPSRYISIVKKIMAVDENDWSL